MRKEKAKMLNAKTANNTNRIMISEIAYLRINALQHKKLNLSCIEIMDKDHIFHTMIPNFLYLSYLSI